MNGSGVSTKQLGLFGQQGDSAKTNNLDLNPCTARKGGL
jgi:hypothetical protein